LSAGIKRAGEVFTNEYRPNYLPAATGVYKRRFQPLCNGCNLENEHYKGRKMEN
jgi:hypothetical protein